MLNLWEDRNYKTIVLKKGFAHGHYIYKEHFVERILKNKNKIFISPSFLIGQEHLLLDSQNRTRIIFCCITFK